MANSPYLPPRRPRRRTRPPRLGIETFLIGGFILGISLILLAGVLLIKQVFAAKAAHVRAGTTPRPTLALPPPWDGKERINVLLLGVDDRPWEKNWGAPRSDTIILLTLDPKTMSGGAISLPRDLWVNIPGFGYHKLNQAYQLGEAYLGEGQGALLAMKTVGQLLGVPVHHYIVVNFRAFIAFVDAIHGVKVHVRHRMALDVFEPDGTRRLHALYPGVTVLPGDLALAYARNRSVGGNGDFGRMERQQQVLEGVLERLKNPKVLAELTVKAPILAVQLKDSLHTDISVKDALRLARLAAEVPRSRIHLVVIDQKEAQATMTPQGVYILVPDIKAIRAAASRVFNPPKPTPTPSPTASPTPPPGITVTPTPNLKALRTAAVAENPHLIVLNGTTVNGLACRTAALLKKQGFTQIETGNAKNLTSKTEIRNYTPKRHSLTYLMRLMNVPEERVFYISSAQPPADLVIVLGNDWAKSKRLKGIKCSP